MKRIQRPKRKRRLDFEKLNKKPDVFSSYIAGQLAQKKASNKGPNVRWVELKSILQKGVKFADDQGMVAQSEKGLQKLKNAVNNAGKLYDMKMNVKKTKIMRV